MIWGGEFGRTPMGEVREKGKIGRNHHIDAYTMLMAGGGIKAGQVVGGTDELGFSPAERQDRSASTCRRRSCTCSGSTTRS